MSRQQALADAQYNTVLVGRSFVRLDLLTDSWAEIGGVAPSPPSSQSVNDLLGQRFGFPHTQAVASGRLAEALLARAIVRPGSVVLVSGAFPTTRLHIEDRQGQVVDITDHRSTGAIDLAKLKEQLHKSDVSAVWLEPCCNALSGRMLGIERLTEVSRLCRDADVLLVLDGARLYENAVMLTHALGGDVDAWVRAVCDLCDATASSLTKDFYAQRGAFVGARDPQLFAKVQSWARLGTGTGMNDADHTHLAAALQRGGPWTERVDAVRSICQRLADNGVPVCQPGGHAVYVDSAAWLPAHPHPAASLAAELFLKTGIRVAPNMADADMAQSQYLRLALPLGTVDEACTEQIVRGFAQVTPSSVPVLHDIGGAPGMAGEFVRFYRPSP